MTAGDEIADSPTASSTPRRWAWLSTTWGAALGLLLLVLAVYAWPALPHFATVRLAYGTDSQSFSLYFAWNLHALTHWQNPFFLPNLYAPYGLDLGNGITLPVAGFVLAPVTAAFGGTAAYNVCLLGALVLAGLAVYLLAREVSGSRVGAGVAGGLMTLSPYLTAHAVGHLNLVCIAGFPLLAYLALRRYRGTLGPVRAALGVAVAVLGTAGTSVELLLTGSFFAVVALALTLAFAASPERRRWWQVLPGLGAGVAGGFVAAAPIFYAALRHGRPAVSTTATGHYSSDLLNLVSSTPTPVLPLGQRLPGVHFGSNLAENSAWLPWPLLLLLVVLLLRRPDRTNVGLLVFAGFALIASFGPRLLVDGHPSVWMPWSLMAHVPGLDAALPNRFTAYTDIAVLVALARAFRGARLPRWVPATAAGLTALLVLPSPAHLQWTTPVADSDFVRSGAIEAQIRSGENVLVLPGGQNGPGFYWLEVTGFGFRMPTGNGGGGTVPTGLADPTARAIFAQNYAYPFTARLLPYLRRVGVRTVIVADGCPRWKAIADAALGVPGQRVTDVWVYRLPG